jgi:hypothetical protein
MADLVPVDHDPFARPQAPTGVPVEGDPFAQKPPGKSYSSTIWPLTRDEKGIHFDTDAGLIGMAKRALTLPGDVYTGKVDPKSDEGLARTLEMATAVTPVSPAARIGERAIPGPLKAFSDTREPVPVPTADALKAAGGAGIDKASNMGVDYSANAVKNMAEAFRAQAERQGFRDTQAPDTFDVINALSKPPADSVAGFQDLIAARRAAQNAAQNFNKPVEQRVASALIQEIDRFLEGRDPKAVVAGPASAASDLYKAGNANYASGMRSDFLNGREELADLRAAASNSGRNYDNAMRQRLIAVIDPTNGKLGSGFNQAEKDAIEGVIRGDTTRNAARTVANKLGGGGGVIPTGIGGTVGALIGTSVGSPVAGAAAGAALGALPGEGAKMLQNALARKAFKNVDEMVRMRSPLYEDALAASPFAAKDPARRAALIRALLGEKQSDNR